MRWVVRVVPVLLLAASLSSLFAPRGAETLPLYASRTGLLCQSCHFDPNGGGPRNEFGFAFAKNRHSLEAEPDSTSEWFGLDLTNRVGESFPLYFGLNHRVLLLANSATVSDSLDRVGFFNMENALHVAFQPHRRLALVHSRDGSIARESFGWIGGLPLEGYLKAGEFRNPFGMRIDDHTVATRNGFLDFYRFIPDFSYRDYVRERYLPFDPRNTDLGLEYGGSIANFYGRVSFTNGPNSHALFANNTFAQAKSIKVGYTNAWYQSGLSFYDDFVGEPIPAPGFTQRATRWSYYGMLHRGPFVLMGEIGAGTDDLVGLGKVNSLAGFAELDWHPTRALNFRGRYDYMNLDRDDSVILGFPTPVTRTFLNTHARYSLEGEVVPVPFAEIRWTLRYIDHRADQDPLGVEIEDEKQAYVQFHFSY